MGICALAGTAKNNVTKKLTTDTLILVQRILKMLLGRRNSIATVSPLSAGHSKSGGETCQTRPTWICADAAITKYNVACWRPRPAGDGHGDHAPRFTSFPP